MVTYICEKCDRVFNKKSSYQVHMNRKFPCAPEGNRIDKLEEKNKILEKKIEDLTKLVEHLMSEKKINNF
jgi:uncharacterized C2H2 Zn-finger protein